VILRSLTANVGTLCWIAPEILSHQKYAEPADIYALGIIMWEIMHRALPFENIPPFQIPSIVMKGERPNIDKEVPEKMAKLIKRCWDGRPQKRPKAEEILDVVHSLLNKRAYRTTLEESHDVGSHSSSEWVDLRSDVKSDTRSETSTTGPSIRKSVSNFRTLGDSKSEAIPDGKSEILDVSQSYIDSLVEQSVARSASFVDKGRDQELLDQAVRDMKMLIELEKTEDCDIIEKTNYQIQYRVFGKSAKAVVKVISTTLKADYERVYNFIKENFGSKVMMPYIEQHKVVEQYTDNISVDLYIVKLHYLPRREILTMRYSEILPSMGLGLISFRSIKREDVPSKYTRLKIFSGFMVRSEAEGRCTVSYIAHVDGKGLLSLVPRGVLRATIKRQVGYFGTVFQKLEETCG